MEEIPLSESSDSFEKVSSGSTDFISSQASMRKDSNDSFLQINFEDCLPKSPSYKKTKEEPLILDIEVDNVQNLVECNKLASLSQEKSQSELEEAETASSTSRGHPKNKTTDVSAIPILPKNYTTYPIDSKKEDKTKSKRKSKYELVQERKKKRLIRNRASAKLHRERQKLQKKMILEELEQLKIENLALRNTLNNLMKTNLELKQQLATEKQENQALRDENSRILAYSSIPNENEDEIANKIDTSSLFSQFFGSNESDSYQENNNIDLEMPENTATLIFDDTESKRKNSIVFFAFSFLLFFFSLSGSSSSSLEATNINTELDAKKNISQHIIMNSTMTNSNSLVISSTEEIFLSNNDFFLPFSTGNLLDMKKLLSSTLASNTKSEKYKNERAIVLMSAFEEAQSKPQQTNTYSWDEFSRLNTLLQSKLTYFLDGKLTTLDQRSQAVTIYRNDEISAHLEAYNAVQKAVSTYMSYLAGSYKKEDQKIEYKPNYVLCPTAYGAVEETRKRKSENAKSLTTTDYSRGRPSEYVSSDMGSLKDTVLNLVLPATYPIKESSQKVVMELKCRVEDVTEYLVPK